jgi:hypothetical protein
MALDYFIAANRKEITGDALVAPQAPGCPRCRVPDGTLSLLTSMTRYYVCRHCEWRWQVSRSEDGVASVNKSRPDHP